MNSMNDVINVSRSTLEGTVKLSGAKNSALRLLAASILTDQPVELENFPESLLDIQVHLEMLQALGKNTEVSDDHVHISEPSGKLSSVLRWEKRSIRNTLLILGALTTRFSEGKVPLPGGCKLGERKYDIHVHLLEALGAKVWEEGDYLCAESTGRLRGADIHLPIRSTGATENAILCASLAEGTSTIWNPHIRPEIIDLIEMLRSMGANISVFGQERIEVVGVEALKGTKHTVIADNMEAITWAIASVITGGNIEILNFPFDHLEVPLVYLRESGMRYYRGKDSLIVRGGVPYPVEISTGPYPGINSDMQPLFAVYGLCSKGTSKIVDLRFPGRYGYMNELQKMGAKHAVKGDLLEIDGGINLSGAVVKALDLRAGMALLLAGMVAEGSTTVTSAWQIERGYNKLDQKLRSIGAQFERSNS